MPPKSRDLFLLPDAAEELASIYDPLYSHIVHQLRILKKFPKLGKPLALRAHRSKSRKSPWRCLVVEFFFIVYREVPRGIEVAQVRHTKRHPVTLEELIP